MRPPLEFYASTCLQTLRLRSTTRLLSQNAMKRCLSSETVLTPPTAKPYYITTPIFYVNAAPHAGHLYTLVLTDILKRWQQLRGKPTVLCTGTDEHGMKIQQAAQLAEADPKTFCNSGANSFKTLANTAKCSYDTFIRTTDPAHYDAVQYFWRMLQVRDFIYTGKHEGWYSVSDETFHPTSGVESILDPATGQKITISKETGRPVEWTSETNYHFRLSSMAPRLLEFYERNPEFVVPHARYLDVISSVERGLEDLSISRPRERLTWGIPVPSDPTQTIYVWLDALVNYITASGYPWTPGSSSAWPADLHVVGKDIAKFHCVYWPAFLLALDIPPPKQILTHAHWTMNRKKMSKTDGNVVNPFYAIQRYGVDTMRFYMARDGGINDDGDYSNEKIVERYKHELQSGLGNLVNRVCGKNFDIVAARTQSASGLAGDWDFDTRDHLLRTSAEMTTEDVAELMNKLDVPGALKKTISLVHETNKYLQHAAPWTLKSEDEKGLQNKIIFLSSECIRVAGILLQPFMPDKAKEVLNQLSVEKTKRNFEYAAFGADDTYGVGTKGRKGMVFPPLSEWQRILYYQERDPNFQFRPWKDLDDKTKRVLKFGPGEMTEDGMEPPPLVRRVMVHAKVYKKRREKKKLWLEKKEKKLQQQRRRKAETDEGEDLDV